MAHALEQSIGGSVYVLVCKKLHVVGWAR
jgi:hypothetical protein